MRIFSKGSLLVLAAGASLMATVAIASPENGKGGNGKKHSDVAGASLSVDGPQIDIGGIRVVLGKNREYWSAGASLPPGIRKNLARGKPLPPGIAKRLDSRLVQRLPHHDGYEWMQTGRDLILVTAATGIIYEVLQGVFD